MKLDKIFCFFEILRSCKIYLRHKSRSKENANDRIICVLTLLQNGDSVIAVARDIGAQERHFFD